MRVDRFRGSGGWMALFLLLVVLTPVRRTAAAGRGVFAPTEQAPRYASERLYHLQHLRLDLAFDLIQGTVAGTATNVVTPLLPGVDHLLFHAAELDVKRVLLAGRAVPLPFALDPAAQSLTVQLGRAYGPQDRLEVAIDYAAHPRAGLYFTAPDAAYPEMPRALYSQGETAYNRYWFPSWDEPDERATSELLGTVARPFEVIGNGRLVEVLEREDGRRTFHWTMEQPHSTYLVSVAAGEFAHAAGQWRGIPIDSYAPPALASYARRALAPTADMMELFSTLTGRPYPYAKYAQVWVHDFGWDGMENISASTESVRALDRERQEPVAETQALVAHELAHQWFGDLLTCRGWEHAWLNEGMATYFEALYRQHVSGDDDFDWELEGLRRSYFGEDEEHYRRPLVTARYVSPDRMFDAHSYDKGALVVHMLRYLMGEEGWRKGIREYVARHAGGSVTTADLQAAFESASGASLGSLLDQYVYGAGYPELKVRWDYQAGSGGPGMVHLEVRQVQKLDAETGLFSFPVEIALLGESGSEVRRVPVLARAAQELYIPSPTRPRTVIFDPRGVMLKTIDFDKPVAEWVLQLAAAGPLPARIEAARALGKSAAGADPGPASGKAGAGAGAGGADSGEGEGGTGTGEGGARPGAPAATAPPTAPTELDAAAASQALAQVLASQAFYGLREEAATALGENGGAGSLGALRRGLADPEARVRTAVYAALGRFPDHRELVAPLGRALREDAGERARAAAATALGKFQDSRGEVVPLLVRALGQVSYHHWVQRAAIKALARLGARQTYDEARRLARYGSPEECRSDAMLALATYAAHSTESKLKAGVRRILEGYLADPDYAVRRDVPRALAELGDPAAIPALARTARSEIEDAQRQAREDAIHDLEELRRKPRETQGLEERVRQLERANEVLQEQLRELKAPAAPPHP
ncbi:MAG TPA: M1 family aminopeptidase [Thermoanaerobaculia bacterium]|nr:M1 family aminopeptidase [Thermoanaerobaculia bacterium]